MTSKHSYIISLRDIDHKMLPIAGGKAANLGILGKIPGIHVPDGCCVSAEAFKRLVRIPSVNILLEQLAALKTEDKDTICQLSAGIRKTIEGLAIPSDISEEISHYITASGKDATYAIRSSATAEDLPHASFAGQQDTYLNISGQDAILKHISKCWASLYTERAIIYRIRNGFDHRKVQLAVIIQKMIFPKAAGILFTADPLTSNRKVVSIDASFGLGESLVSGLVNADSYQVRDDKIIDKKISDKQVAIYASKDGGTQKQEIAPEYRQQQTLTDKQIIQLAQIGRKIEGRFGCPQDIEWCLADETFYIVQSRPITTLYPIPETDDQEKHVYISVGHNQMMTDAMKPLGLSFFLLTTSAPMYTAGSRLFVDVTQQLGTSAGQQSLLNTIGKSDPLIKDALLTIMAREGFIKPLPADRPTRNILPPTPPKIENDQTVAIDLVRDSQLFIATLKQDIQTKSSTALFDFILENMQQAKERLYNSQSLTVIMAALNAYFWINEKMYEWLGEENAADTLSQSVPNNVTSEMGLALLDLADVIRPYPGIIWYLQHLKDDNFLEELFRFEGGGLVRDAIHNFLDKYGMRCVGEIDITRTRWSEKPATLIPVILNNIRNFQPGAGKQKFEQGLQEALGKENTLLERLQQLPDGEEKVRETKEKIHLIRNFIGYREYPKYVIVSRYFIYKQALMKEAEILVQHNIIREKEDVYYLSFEEFRELVRTRQLDYDIINRRKEAFLLHEKLTPPRVMTSDGEIITGHYQRDNIPAGALAGLAVSAGITEGRARVISDIGAANLEEGDILVTTFTDPSWTPLFVSIKGLITEVGGLMTHGAVIAREYGLPAVVGVENATRLIKDGQRIRINGTAGYVELL